VGGKHFGRARIVDIHIFLRQRMHATTSSVMAVTQDTQAGAAAIADLLLSGAVLLLSREWKGVRSGAVLRPAVQRSATVATVLLCAATLWNVALICYRLAQAPGALGNKDELGITAAASRRCGTLISCCSDRLSAESAVSR
jgi:hypothetical protein